MLIKIFWNKLKINILKIAYRWINLNNFNFFFCTFLAIDGNTKFFLHKSFCKCKENDSYFFIFAQRFAIIITILLIENIISFLFTPDLKCYRHRSTSFSFIRSKKYSNHRSSISAYSASFGQWSTIWWRSFRSVFVVR